MEELKNMQSGVVPSDYLIAKVCKELIGDQLRCSHGPQGRMWADEEYSVRSNSHVKKLILKEVLPIVKEYNYRIEGILTMTSSLNYVIEMLHALIL